MTNLEKILRERGLYTGKSTATRSGLAQIAREVGIGRNTLSRHIHQHACLSLPVLRKVAVYLNVKVDDLLDNMADAKSEEVT